MASTNLSPNRYTTYFFVLVSNERTTPDNRNKLYRRNVFIRQNYEKNNIKLNYSTNIDRQSEINHLFTIIVGIIKTSINIPNLMQRNLVEVKKVFPLTPVNMRIVRMFWRCPIIVVITIRSDVQH